MPKTIYIEREINILNRIVTMYLDFAELQALEENQMTMSEWIEQLDIFIKMNRRDILSHSGTVSHKEALEKARQEYSKYKDKQITEPTEVELHYRESARELDRKLAKGDLHP